MRKYPVALMTKEARENNRISIINNYRSGIRKPVYLGEKRPDHSNWLLNAYKKGIRKIVSMPSEKNPSWKGSKASYSAFHHWLNNHKKREYWCFLGDHKIEKKSEFANISNSHNHDIDLYIEACTSCHRLFDYNRILF